MNTIRGTAIFVAVCILFLAICGHIENTYYLDATVTSLSVEYDTTSYTDRNGNIWQTDLKSFEIGSKVRLTMSCNGTYERFDDDIILKVRIRKENIWD